MAEVMGEKTMREVRPVASRPRGRQALLDLDKKRVLSTKLRSHASVCCQL